MEVEFKPQIYGFWENLHQLVKYMIVIGFMMFAYITYNQPGSQLRNFFSTILLVMFFLPIALILYFLVKSGMRRVTKLSGKLMIIIFDIFFVVIIITAYQQSGGENNQIAAIIALGSLVLFPIFSFITFNLPSTKEYLSEKAFADNYIEL